MSNFLNILMFVGMASGHVVRLDAEAGSVAATVIHDGSRRHSVMPTPDSDLQVKGPAQMSLEEKSTANALFDFAGALETVKKCIKEDVQTAVNKVETKVATKLGAAAKLVNKVKKAVTAIANMASQGKLMDLIGIIVGSAKNFIHRLIKKACKVAGPLGGMCTNTANGAVDGQINKIDKCSQPKGANDGCDSSTLLQETQSFSGDDLLSSVHEVKAGRSYLDEIFSVHAQSLREGGEADLQRQLEIAAFTSPAVYSLLRKSGVVFDTDFRVHSMPSKEKIVKSLVSLREWSPSHKRSADVLMAREWRWGWLNKAFSAVKKVATSVVKKVGEVAGFDVNAVAKGVCDTVGNFTTKLTDKLDPVIDSLKDKLVDVDGAAETLGKFGGQCWGSQGSASEMVGTACGKLAEGGENEDNTLLQSMCKLAFKTLHNVIWCNHINDDTKGETSNATKGETAPSN